MNKTEAHVLCASSRKRVTSYASCILRTRDPEQERLYGCGVLAVSSLVGDPMELIPTAIPDVIIIIPRVFHDDRGFFFESFNSNIAQALGLNAPMVQDNQSHSRKNVVRGLHYQIEQPQGKLVRVVSGQVFDVAVDLRRRSTTFGKWVGVELSESNHRIFWIPPGFAHGFLAQTDTVDMLYKTTAAYAPQSERTILWNDPDLGIKWPLTGQPLLSAKDCAAVPFCKAEVYD